MPGGFVGHRIKHYVQCVLATSIKSLILLIYFEWRSDKRTNSLAPRQPEKDLPRRPRAADRHSNIGPDV